MLYATGLSVEDMNKPQVRDCSHQPLACRILAEHGAHAALE